MGAKSVITLVAVCLAIIIASSLLIGLSIYDGLATLEKELSPPSQPPIHLPGEITQLPVQINQPSNSPGQGGSEPYLTFAHLTVLDDRTKLPYKLQVSCLLNNTGGGTAYNAVLHVLAFNKEGKAIDYYYLFGGMTPHVTLGISFTKDYTGSKILNCAITPIYTGSLPPVANTTTTATP
jgi:hypothetical protein